MIVLLNCSINLLANDNLHSSTGGVDNLNDSVLISYSDLKIVNSKLIELRYEKEINNNLRNIIYNDSIIIQEHQRINTKIKEDYNKSIKQRNIAIGGGILFFITSLFLIFK